MDPAKLALPNRLTILRNWRSTGTESPTQGGDHLSSGSAFGRQWAEREFGRRYAGEIADITSKYAKYNGWRKPEVITPDTFSQINFNEADYVRAAWEDLTVRAEAVYKALPDEKKDAFYQLVLHPTKASGIVAQMNIAAGRNLLFARQGRASTNAEASRVRDLFRQDEATSNYYNHKLAGGKWNHMMDQTHLGQYTWQPPRVDMMPAVCELLVADSDDYAVAIEGDVSAWPDHFGDAILPVFESLNPRTSYVDVFAQGSQPFKVNVTTENPWIVITKAATPNSDLRYLVSIDWDKAPVGESKGFIIVSGKLDPIRISVPAIRASDTQRAQAKECFAAQNGILAFAASKAQRRTQSGGVRWEVIPDYGRGAEAMSVFPALTPSFIAPAEGPALEYDLYLARGGDYTVTLVMGPVMDFMPDRGVRIAVGIDNREPQMLDLFADRTAGTFLGATWLEAAKDNVRYLSATVKSLESGRHVLSVGMIDPAVVV
ncbi:hypothetical protein [Asticcacaulis taihuensis]|uniref:hypothetical protein n=1 Tax=Asticcacaulis taihuensis TaxID=260084 RepID=UPI003F7B49E9